MSSPSTASTSAVAARAPASAFVNMNRPWDKRPGAQNRVLGRSPGGRWGTSCQYRDAMAFAFAPPPVLELGNATGFDFELLDRANLGHDALMGARNQLLGLAAQDHRTRRGAAERPRTTSRSTTSTSTEEKANALGLTIADINDTLSAAWGSQYVNDFIDRGRDQARVHPGRRAVPHAAGGFWPLVRAQHPGADGALLGLRAGELGFRLAQAGALQRRAVGGDPGLARARRQHRHRDGDHGNSWRPSCRQGLRASNGPASRTRSRRPARRPGCSTACRWRWCSCASPRSTRAGRSRSR